ncbi:MULTISPECIES: helix-turn-helix domain-containing protein [Paracoccus]|jgi:cytoskeletal protein RodZ|uniref:Cytoskeleton protein RodZ-like C-terminal domain-containing protein n=1 Tax=Paracoccus denitrificans (strain Pd 1222) TaxID=318586 RepID=A1B324_PARDP|nr:MULTISPECIES: helix-turn-helix domain-containing protein [Paracoccus]ABL69918.1 conserved hypothetical protein [Paracoccus denitrificans PD1222]MCU7428384.1 DUF4115 domain-containing protein [Paracoccus denitrificans]QAR25307.1 helix-turn-helix domain-containing protein [Paracoccus denitrificans]UFS65105.1 DUF4115 domain-containing protein [Paracoccus denitrificans]UPV94190.1 DUF4115 domain-containing protein [Paracoccus denitrificans]
MIGLRGNPPSNGHEEPAALPPGFDDPDIRLGDLMRGERATLGKSLLDVQRELRIRASYVAAIENCDISAFDTPSFIAGYVRSYARYLGMDADWTFRRFCQESGFQPTHGMAPSAAGPKPQRRPSDPAEALANPHPIFLPRQESVWNSIEPRAIGSLLVMVVLACGLGYGGWTVLQEVQKVNLTPGDQAPGVIAALDPVQEAAEPETVESAQVNLPRPEGLDRTYRPQALEVPVLMARDGPIAAIDPGLNAPAMQPEGAEPVARIAAVQDRVHGPQMPAEQAAVRTVAPDAPEVEILAARPAWVRVTSADGTVLLEKTMDAGERFALPKLEAPPVLRAGNSGAIYFAVNGRTYGPAAPGAKVVKNVELSPNALTAKFAFADLAKDPQLAEMVSFASAGQAEQVPVQD